MPMQVIVYRSLQLVDEEAAPLEELRGDRPQALLHVLLVGFVDRHRVLPPHGHRLVALVARDDDEAAQKISDKIQNNERF